MIHANKKNGFIRVFRLYNRRYLQKHFFRFHYSAEFERLELDEPLPVLVILNHSSWWDVMAALYLAYELFPFDSYAVMDEEQLRRYRFFSKLGFYSIDRESKFSGAKEFLRASEELLRRPNTAVWMTPQGNIVSNDLRPVRFYPGLAHLVKHLGRCWVLPISLDYEFWQEPQPETFALAGKPVKITGAENTDVETLNRRLEAELTRVMDALREKTERRDPSLFQQLLAGKKGIHKFYDAVTSLRYALQGKKFHATHGNYK